MSTIPFWLVLVAIGFWKLRKQNDKMIEQNERMIRQGLSRVQRFKPKARIKIKPNKKLKTVKV